jgi:hypothetical protein
MRVSVPATMLVIMPMLVSMLMSMIMIMTVRAVVLAVFMFQWIRLPSMLKCLHTPQPREKHARP